MSHCDICGAPLSTGGTCYYETQHTGTDINVLVSDEGTIGPAGLHAEIRRLTRERDEARSLLRELGPLVDHYDAATTAELERLTRERDEACEGESLRAQERDAARRERDRYRAVLALVRDDGCVHWYHTTTGTIGTCRSSDVSRDEWCLSCRATEVLEER